jgi:hypothetical protein
MRNQLLNKIHSNIFTEDEIKSIYNEISNADDSRTETISIYRQKAYFVDMPYNIIEKVTNIANSIYNEKLQLTEISFANYSIRPGQEDPILSPHFDNTFLEPRVTLDVQLKSNIDWPILVEGQSFTLKNNEALTFSGTHQVHWREYRKFKEEDFIDMLFCHFTIKDNPKKITMDEKITIESQSIYWMNKFYQDIMKDLKQ